MTLPAASVEDVTTGTSTPVWASVDSTGMADAAELVASVVAGSAEVGTTQEESQLLRKVELKVASSQVRNEKIYDGIPSFAEEY
jgi:hypothetical protein